jgi:hypothetical protein
MSMERESCATLQAAAAAWRLRHSRLGSHLLRAAGGTQTCASHLLPLLSLHPNWKGHYLRTPFHHFCTSLRCTGVSPPSEEGHPSRRKSLNQTGAGAATGKSYASSCRYPTPLRATATFFARCHPKQLDLTFAFTSTLRIKVCYP